MECLQTLISEREMAIVQVCTREVSKCRYAPQKATQEETKLKFSAKLYLPV